MKHKQIQLRFPLKTGSFGHLICSWFVEQKDLESLDLCCARDDSVHFIRDNSDQKHVAAIVVGGRFYTKLLPEEDMWDTGVSLSMGDPTFFEKLHAKLVKANKP